MNRFLLRVFLPCLVFIVHAQSQTSTEYATHINAVFANLDISKVPHKLLVDYAMEFAELSAFNGVSLSNSNMLHRGSYTEVYNTLLMARVQTGQS